MGEPTEVELDLGEVTQLMFNAREKLHQSLLDVAKMCSDGNPDWRPVLLRVFSMYSDAIGFDIDVSFPIKKLEHELAETVYKASGKIARNGVALNKSMALTTAAAILTILNDRGAYPKVNAAAAAVATAAGINPGEIEQQRHEIGRGKRPAAVKMAYDSALLSLSGRSNEDLLKRAALLREFVK